MLFYNKIGALQVKQGLKCGGAVELHAILILSQYQGTCRPLRLKNHYSKILQSRFVVAMERNSHVELFHKGIISNQSISGANLDLAILEHPWQQ